MLRKSAVAAATFAAATLLFGCGSPTTDNTTGTAPVTTQPTTAPPPTTEPAPVVEETTEPPAEPVTNESKIAGDWVTYESGLAVKVTRAKVFTPSDTSFGSKPGERGVAITLSIKNATAAVFDAASASVKLSYGPDGVEAEEVFDSAKGYSGGFEGSISRGKTKTASVAFSVPTKYLKSLTIEVAPDWDSESAFFTGGAGSK